MANKGSGGFERMGLAPRWCNALRRNGIMTVWQLRDMRTKDIAALHGIGKAGTRQIEEKMARRKERARE